ncbi:MAG TPA: pyridoxamine 5'-phosphate oxidase [Salinimicrobium sp.]|nr:pyridoxamine 5'-phosphate oxidase [Salinimicrobium sp.]
MKKQLHHYRKSYEKFKLGEQEISEHPLSLFETWFKEAEQSLKVDEVNAMTLSTIGKDGFPKSRVVLLKQFDLNGFVFFTNYNSEKGQAMEKNPHVCLSFFWPALERQIIIKGIAEKVSEEESEFYFQSRPRGSQLGAHASNQSSEISSREELDKHLQKLEVEYEGKEIPKPNYWGGYNISPSEYEFWQGRKNRLHDRIRYKLIEDNWQINRLAP